MQSSIGSLGIIETHIRPAIDNSKGIFIFCFLQISNNSTFLCRYAAKTGTSAYSCQVGSHQECFLIGTLSNRMRVGPLLTCVGEEFSTSLPPFGSSSPGCPLRASATHIGARFTSLARLSGGMPGTTELQDLRTTLSVSSPRLPRFGCPPGPTSTGC